MLPICEHHAVIFKSIKNPNLYILGVHYISLTVNFCKILINQFCVSIGR